MIDLVPAGLIFEIKITVFVLENCDQTFSGIFGTVTGFRCFENLAVFICNSGEGRFDGKAIGITGYMLVGITAYPEPLGASPRDTIFMVEEMHDDRSGATTKCTFINLTLDIIGALLLR